MGNGSVLSKVFHVVDVNIFGVRVSHVANEDTIRLLPIVVDHLVGPRPMARVFSSTTKVVEVKWAPQENSIAFSENDGL